MSGIEVELRASKGAGAVAKVFHALHLDAAVAKLQASTIRVAMTVDGTETMFPMRMPSRYLVACPPGRRRLDVSVLGLLGLGRWISHAVAHVDVEPGHVTMVNFVMGLGVASYALEVAGTRPG